MRLLVTGANGMLGRDLVAEIQERGHEAVPTDVQELSITDPMEVARIAGGEFGKLDWIVNCAAYTAVDKAESEPQLAHELNAFAPGYLANVAKISGARLLQLSTDFVFDGSKTEPYTEDDKPNPLGVYGESKLAGEEAVMMANSSSIVVRTAWLYGPLGNSFPRTMIRGYEAGKTLRVVSDQIGCPTYTADLARVLIDLIEKDAAPGIYHAVGPETMTWHELAVLAIAAWTGTRPQLEAITTDEYLTPAKRPRYSVLSTAKMDALGIQPMRPVRDALREFVERARLAW